MNPIQAIADVLASILQYLKEFTGSYVAAIALLTVLIKGVLHPLTRKQLQSMRAMQVLAPQMTALREKYRDDPQQLNKEMMALYRAHGVNPLGGCLPVLLQFPILYGLLAMFRRPEIFQDASLLGASLAKTPCSQGPWAILSSGCWQDLVHPPVLLAVVVLVGLTTYLQQRMSVTDPQQARVLVFMPVMFAAFAVSFPLALSIYWTVYSLASIGEYWLVNRLPAMVPPPPAPEVLPQRPKGSKKK